jgi:WD40 repeat protein
MLVVACADAVIRCFDVGTLDHIATLPRLPPLGKANITTANRRTIESDEASVYADTTSVLLLGGSGYLYSLYSDRSVFIWDIK